MNGRRASTREPREAADRLLLELVALFEFCVLLRNPERCCDQVNIYFVTHGVYPRPVLNVHGHSSSIIVTLSVSEYLKYCA